MAEWLEGAHQVGTIDQQRDDDPIFDNYDDAEEEAITQSYNDSPIGIWDLSKNELVTIVYQQKVFREE